MDIAQLLQKRYEEKGIRAVVVRDEGAVFRVRFPDRYSTTIAEIKELDRISGEVHELVKAELLTL